MIELPYRNVWSGPSLRRTADVQEGIREVSDNIRRHIEILRLRSVLQLVECYLIRPCVIVERVEILDKAQPNSRHDAEDKCRSNCLEAPGPSQVEADQHRKHWCCEIAEVHHCRRGTRFARTEQRIEHCHRQSRQHQPQQATRPSPPVRRHQPAQANNGHGAEDGKIRAFQHDEGRQIVHSWREH